MNKSPRSLEDLRLERSTTNPFTSKIEFDRWADEVRPHLAGDQLARRDFNNRAAVVETMYAFKKDPLNAINECIGVFNVVAKARALASLKPEPAEGFLETPEKLREQEVANEAANQKVHSIRAWLRKFWDAESTKIVAALILGGIFFLIKFYFGVSLKP